MLFVHDRQPQTFECDAFLDQGVRADRDLDAPGGEVCDLVFFRRRFVTASEQRRVDTKTVQKRAEIPVVLFSENFGGGHQCRLIPGSTGEDDRVQGDNRFARSDVALHQAIHRTRRDHVAEYFPDDLVLSGGQRKGENTSQLVQKRRARIKMQPLLFDLDGPLSRSQRHLQQKQFLERQSTMDR
jgi:hypothetical protein